MKVVCLSDTHGHHRDVKVPRGDVLLHAGDCTDDDGQAALRDFLRWFQVQPHDIKIFIAGNHDRAFEKWPDLAKKMVMDVAPSVRYLEDSSLTFVMDGRIWRVWGSPYTPAFCDWAFNRERGKEIRHHWDMIPEDTDILITHGPPFGVLDKSGIGGEKCGCRDLYAVMQEIRPRMHVFGHIHHSHGYEVRVHDNGTRTDHINASICDEGYRPTHKPIIIEL